jgi:hypothetical protein
MNTGTMRVEVSTDEGATWQPALVRSMAPPSPPDAPLPDGYRWCGVHEQGKPVRWVPMIAVDC